MVLLGINCLFFSMLMLVVLCLVYLLFGFASLTALYRIPPNSVLTFEVELVSVVN